MKEYSDALEFIRRQYKGEQPEIGIILGTGLGALADQIVQERVIPYNFIPHFPISTVESHFGRLIFGKLGNTSVVAMQGRMHYYEGYSMEEITFPIRILKLLGIHTLFLSGAAGGVNLDYKLGDLVAVYDHINLQTDNPLRGSNINELGPRFPDMSKPYDMKLVNRSLELAKEKGYNMHKGVYVAVTGPNLETPAEYRFMKIIGGDLVGMSTVPEVLVARHMGLCVCAISVITDECDPDNLRSFNLDEVIEIAKQAEPKLTDIISTLIKEL
ncbi:MAG: purine-nucleoside phosphorylase [Bacteroidia bacterium]|nr:purine-nucleoside phosphorylase [Bacteroidia bacterium]